MGGRVRRVLLAGVLLVACSGETASDTSVPERSTTTASLVVPAPVVAGHLVPVAEGAIARVWANEGGRQGHP